VFVLYYCSLSSSSSSSSSSQTKGLSRDERALLLEIASERMRARRGERSVRACFPPRLVSKIKFSEEFAGIDFWFLSFV